MQSFGFMFFIMTTRFLEKGLMEIDKDNPRVYLLSSMASSYFLCGRDINNEPFLGVPSQMMPFFTEMDWSSASLFRRKGCIYLEVYDPDTQDLLLAFGIRIRRMRLNVFSIENHENTEEMQMNIKVFEQLPNEPLNVVFSDQHEIVGLSLKEIDSVEELSTEESIDYAKDLYDHSGLEKTFTVVEVTK